MSPTIAAAAAADMPAISCAIGEATEMIAMPHVMLMNSMSHMK
jgi:hypothetical protein